MKRFAPILIVFMIGCAHRPFEDWTRADTARQVAYTALHIIDISQTVQIAKNPDNFKEIGLLKFYSGEHPSEQQVYEFGITTLILQTAIPAMLKSKYRRIYQWFWIGAEGGNVARNFSIGLHGSF